MTLSNDLAWELKTLNFKNGLGRIRTTRYINGIMFEKSEPQELGLRGLGLNGLVLEDEI